MGDTLPADNALTDRLLRSWLRCRRKAWLDRHGDAADRLWTVHRNLQLDDQQRCFAALLRQPPGRGEASCRAGAESVVGLRLKGSGPSGEPLEAHPPLLRRVKGQSRWGPFAYQPVIARQGRRLTREQQLPLAQMGHQLEQVQDSPVQDLLVLGGLAGDWSGTGSDCLPVFVASLVMLCESWDRTSNVPSLRRWRRIVESVLFAAGELVATPLPPQRGISVR